MSEDKRVRRGGTASELRNGAYVASNTSGYSVDQNDGSYDRAESARLGRSAFRHTVNSEPVGEEYNISFLPNVLDQFDTYTYHWKLFITSLENAYNGNVLNRDVQTIIAENGVTELTIDKVELEGISVPSVLSGTGTQTTVKFEIEEPAGAALIDNMYYEATALGIGNWLVMPCYLQLEFRGRDPDSAESVTNGSPGPLSNMKWVWPIKITDAKVHVTQVGSKYEFNAIFYNELAQSNAYFSVLHNVRLENLTNIGYAISELQDKINADQFAKLVDNYSIPDTYRFVVDPFLATQSLILPTDKESNSRSGGFFDIKAKTASFNAGTSVDKIIDTLFLNTEFYKKSLQGSQTPTSQPGTATTMPNQMKKLWRVVTETLPVAYDPLRQDNAVQITVYIIPYDIGTLDINASQTGQTPDTLGAAKKRMSEYLNKKILNKIYNYIFTGLNDQIINFDLRLNYAYTVALSRFGGIYVDSSTQSSGAVAQDNAKAEKELGEKLRNTLKFLNNATDNKQSEQKIAELRTEINKSTIDQALKDRYNLLLNYAKPTDRLSLINSLKSVGGIGEAAGGPQYFTYKSLSESANEFNLKFVSDINTRSPQAQEAVAVARATRKGKLRPIAFRESNQDLTSINGITPSADASAARVSSIFSTALYTQLDASLQTIKMTIKGDPYWLFPSYLTPEAATLPILSRMTDSEAINYLKNSHKLFPDTINFFGTDNFLILRFRTPKIYSEIKNGEEPYTEVQTFSGVYRVITVTSKFEKGKFTQDLSCNLDPMIDLTDFLGYLGDIEKSIREPGKIITNQTQTTAETARLQRYQRVATENLAPGQTPRTLPSPGGP
jgi:hypothetical protein